MTRPLRVLVVEDSQDDALLAVRRLRRGGFDPVYERVETAVALQGALKQPWDVILCDHAMPKLNAPAALRMARERCPDIPFILVSARIEQEAALTCMLEGACDYITKDDLARLTPVVERELKRAQVFRELKELVEAAQEKHRQAYLNHLLAAMEDLAAGVAREINNPLTVLIHMLQALLRKELAPEVKESLFSINENAWRAYSVSGKLLTFARQGKPEIKPMNVNDAVTAALDVYGHDLKNCKVQVVLQLDPALPRIMADGAQIQHVCLHLVANAMAAMVPDGGRLLAKTVHDGDKVRICFEDDGHGIPTEDLDRIFDPFFTTREPGKGTGLGLSICRGIVAGHGGCITARGRRGRGTAVTVELPLAARA